MCLAAMANGRKLVPMVVFKGKRIPQELREIKGVVVEFSHNGWMQPETTISWISRVWGSVGFVERILVWDSFRCHLVDETQKALKKSRTLMACIPGGCTKLLQPADVSWNKSFKEKYRELYENWLQEDDRKLDVTVHGNPRGPSKLRMVEWVKKAWDSLTSEIIIKSFDCCGITTADPDIINCTRIGGVAEKVRENLSQIQDTTIFTDDKNEENDNLDDIDSNDIDLSLNHLIL